uniref:transposase n=1 Tax=Parasedimentitalea psychrophila TaxID=2997337 RepID=UPI0036F1CE41
MSERYGPRTTVYSRYVRWGERGVWRDAFEAPAVECEDALISPLHGDCGQSPIMRWTASSSRRTGRPLRFEITGAQTHDSKAFGAVIGWQKQPAAIGADKAYGSAAIRQAILDEGALAVIPSKSNARTHIPHPT